MMISGEVRYVNCDNSLINSLIRQIDTDAEEWAKEKGVDDSLPGSIPRRYRNGLGGINIEQVRQDQRQARREVVKGMVRRLLKLRRRR